MTLTVPLVVLAGVISFASPCFLPVVPAYVGYIAGSRAGGTVVPRSRALLQATAFVLGFSTVFMGLWLSLGLVGHALADHRDLLRIAGGGVLVVMGLVLAGWVNLRVFSRDYRLTPRLDTAQSPTVGRSLLLGVAFAAGWTPCIGPILGGVLTLASTSGTVGEGALLLTAYSLGLGVPFVLVALGAHSLTARLGWLAHHHRLVSGISGSLLVVLGFLMITNRFARLASLIPALGL